MQFCLIEKGQIIDGPRPLPGCWRDISGLNLLPDHDLRDLGWRPVVEIKPDHDPARQVLDGPRLEVAGDQVQAIYTVRDKAPEEIAERRRAEAVDALSRSDAGLIRVVEDLISVLVAKNLLTEDDLPQAARAKLAARRELRRKIAEA